MGKEFVNLVSTIITFRLLKAVSKTNLLDKMSFGDLIDVQPGSDEATVKAWMIPTQAWHDS